MRAWPTVALGDLCDVTAGGTPSRTNLANFGGGIPWVKIGDMLQGVITSTGETISRDALDNSAAKLLPPGTVLISIFATIGRTAVLGVEAATNQAIAGVTPRNPNILAPEYLRRFFEYVAATLERRARGVAQANINSGILRTLPIPLPPLPEQRRIAEVLDRAEALRAKRRLALAQLDILTQAIFLDMFGDPATNPKGWPLKRISEIGTVITGSTPPRAVPEYYGTEIEWIKSDNINTPHYYLTPADEGLSALGKEVARTAPAGSVLVTCIAGSPECIGNAAMTDREVAFNQQINALIPRDDDSHFLYVQLIVGKRLIQQASTSSMKGMVSKSRFERIMLMCPPLPVQREFSSRVVLIEKLKAKQRDSLTELDALFASLQHRAFRGEL
jgi:type I restriction enzyme S subunit